MRERPLILCAIGACWPGNDASGPNQSFRGMAEALRGRFDFHLIARDRPFGVTEPSPGVDQEAAFAASYLQSGQRAPRGLLREVRKLKPDLLWLNGFFDREFTLPILLAHRLGRLGDLPLLLSPRGEFSPAALRLKPTRKRSFLAAVQAIRLLEKVTLHATSTVEAQMIKSVLPGQARIAIAPNIRPLLQPLPHHPNGILRVAFLGRITAMKNLAFALRVVQDVRAPVQFDIHGPIEDADYWQMCLQMAAALPSHISVTHHDAYASADLPGILSSTDLLFLPTAGENFGHAIFEALSCGVPVLISDRTPWRDLAQCHAGWDLPLNSPETFAQKIDELAAMPQEARSFLRHGARRLAEHHVATSDAVSSTRSMLESLIA